MATIDEGTLLAGRYRLVDRIGEGGMGMVFRSRDDRLDRDVAIKLVRRGPRERLDDELLARFDREARVMAMLRHPNIVTIYDQGWHDDTAFVVMEFLPGPDLGAVQSRSGPLPVEDVLHYGGQVTAALECLHGNDTPVVHRDLKPRNLILDQGGVLKVGDFGIAVAPSSGMTRHTRIGRPIGTAAYMSPEQCRGEPTGPPSDVYSFGTVLYSLLTGGPPFPGDFAACAGRITTEEPEPLPDRRPDVPGALADLIHSMLAKQSDARPDAAEVRRELRRVAEHSEYRTDLPGTGASDPADLETAERPLIEGRYAEAGSLFTAPARRSAAAGNDRHVEALAAEFDRVCADAAAGRGAQAAMRWFRLLDRAREELGPDHELTRAIVKFGEVNR